MFYVESGHLIHCLTKVFQAPTPVYEGTIGLTNRHGQCAPGFAHCIKTRCFSGLGMRLSRHGHSLKESDGDTPVGQLESTVGQSKQLRRRRSATSPSARKSGKIERSGGGRVSSHWPPSHCHGMFQAEMAKIYCLTAAACTVHRCRVVFKRRRSSLKLLKTPNHSAMFVRDN